MSVPIRRGLASRSGGGEEEIEPIIERELVAHGVAVTVYDL